MQVEILFLTLALSQLNCDQWGLQSTHSLTFRNALPFQTSRRAGDSSEPVF